MVNNTAELDLIFGALADSTRRSIVTRLAAGSLSVNQLASPFNITLPGILKHLKVLERANLIQRSKQGRVSTVALVPGAMEDAQAWIQKYEVFWNDRFDALERMLDEESEPSS